MNKEKQAEQSDTLLSSNMVYLLSKRVKTFSIRNSFLDDYASHSMINRSLFKGLFTFGVLYTCIVAFRNPIIRYNQTGQAFDFNFYNEFKKEFILCVTTWPLFYLWSYTAFFLQKLILLGLPRPLEILIQYTTQLMMFAYTMYQVLTRNWCTTHAAFTSMVSCTHFMKMHSYTVMNRYYRKDQQESKSAKQPRTPQSPYPHNINFWNFTLFMWMPVLIYEYEYPRNKSVRLSYILQKILQSCFTIITGYIIMTEYILPVLDQSDKITSFELLTRLVIPIAIIDLVMINLLFECILQIFAEITRFGDRRFYEDYWNSSTYEQFNRKWNRVVHLFLFRHVYLECIHAYKLKKWVAQIITIIFSGILHEYILFLVFKNFRPVIFLFMLTQIPLFYLTRSLKDTKAGTYLFYYSQF